MATKEEALAQIDKAQAAMKQAVADADLARRMSAEAGLLTAADIINEGVQEAREAALAALPSVSPYVGTQATQADVQAVEAAEQGVREAAATAGRLVALLVKIAVKAAAI